MNSIKRSASFDIDQPVALVFPLFSAEGEKRWVPNWDYENVMGTTELSEDYIFVTRTHDHAAADAIWLVKRYKPEAWFVQFYRVEPEDKVGIVTIQCAETSTSTTRVTTAYEYIALSDQRRKFIGDFTAEFYEKFIAEWKELLIQYFDSADSPSSSDPLPT